MPNESTDAKMLAELRSQYQKYLACEVGDEVSLQALHVANFAWMNIASLLALAERGIAAEKAETEQHDRTVPQPIGRCPRCQTPVYTDAGFCGGCSDLG